MGRSNFQLPGGCFHWGRRRKKPVQVQSPSEASVSIHEIDEERRGVAVVELQKKEGCGLGLTVSGGSDRGSRAQVSNLRAGSIAQRCDALVVGDYILSVNGIRTSNLRHEEIVNLLKNAGDTVTLEVEYEMPEPPVSQANVQQRQWEVTLDREGRGFGFVLRGGMRLASMRPSPLTVVALRPGGAADRDQHLRVGDRLAAVNGYSVAHLTLAEMESLLQQCGTQATFTVAYDVAVMDAVEHASGPLLVEIERAAGGDLGVVLTHSSYHRRPCVCVESIRPMSVADRSGALHVGDHILSIDGASVEHMSVAEATQLLRSGTDNCVRLEILPVTHLQHCASREALARKSLVPSLSSVTLPSVSGGGSVHNGGLPPSPFPPLAASTSAISHLATLSRGSRGSGMSKLPWPVMERKVNSCMSVVSAGTSVRTAHNQVCRTERTEVMLFADVHGLGIVLEGGVFSTATLSHPPTIAVIEPRSAADRCEVLQEGDRVLQVNGEETVDHTLEEVRHFLRQSRPRVVLGVEFDVGEGVTPASGVYTVQLAKKSAGTGITVGGRRRPEDPIVITDVRRGSAAHRCGSVQPGDKLLAINDVCLERCTVDDVTHLLGLPDDIVKLRLQRDDPDQGQESRVSYMVVLTRHGGPLGITISGTEDPLDDIIISELTAGGLAERTGAMHVGDHLLAINGCTTRNKPLSEAIRLLQAAGDQVTLKIARPPPISPAPNLALGQSEAGSKPTTPIPSVDSALESWDSLEVGGATPVGGAMLVAVPQSHLSTSSSTHCHDPHSFTMDGSREGEELGEGGVSDVDWLAQEGDAHNDDSYANYANDHGDDDGEDGQSEEEEEVGEWVRALGDLEGSGSEMLQQISASLRQRSTLSLDRRSNASDSRQQVQRRQERRKQAAEVRVASKSHEALHRHHIRPSGGRDGGETRTLDDQLRTMFTPAPLQLRKVTVEKTTATADFGFSLSDGRFERGVYVSAIRTGSPAQKAGLRPFDRLLQVNGEKTHDYDCCLVVPLIAQAGKRLSLVVCRNPLLSHPPALRNSAAMETESLSPRTSVVKETEAPTPGISVVKETEPPTAHTSETREPEMPSPSITVAVDVEPPAAVEARVGGEGGGQTGGGGGRLDRRGRRTSLLTAEDLVDRAAARRSMGSVGDLCDRQGAGPGEGRGSVSPGGARTVPKASTLPGDGRVATPVVSSGVKVTLGSTGSDQNGQEGVKVASRSGVKPMVAAKPLVPVGKPPLAAKTSVALAVARLNSAQARVKDTGVKDAS